MSQERQPLLDSLEPTQQRHSSFDDAQLPLPLPRSRTLGSRTGSISPPHLSPDESHLDSAYTSPVLTPHQSYGGTSQNITSSKEHFGERKAAPNPHQRPQGGHQAVASHSKKTGTRARLHHLKTIVLTIIVVFSIVLLAISPESDYELSAIAVSSETPFVIPIDNDPIPPLFRVIARPSIPTFGSSLVDRSLLANKTQIAKRSLFSSRASRAERLAKVNRDALSRILSYRHVDDSPKSSANDASVTSFTISIQVSQDTTQWTTVPDGDWVITAESASNHSDSNPHATNIHQTSDPESGKEEKTLTRTWKLGSAFDSGYFRVLVQTNSTSPASLQIQVMRMPAIAEYEVLLSAFIIVFVYVLIVFELVHRVVAAILGSLVALAVLSICQARPSLEVIISWIDFETCALLFGMMILVAIFSGTGFFEYAAVKAYKLSKGKIWRLITILCIFTALLSAFLDNVTTILLIAPVTIRLCQVIDLDPKPILLAEVLFSNVGGTATAVGDPPNVIIVSNSGISAAGIGFANFTLHLALGIAFVSILSYYTLWWLLRNTSFVQDPIVAELEREVWIWKKASQGLNSSVVEEKEVGAMLRQKIREVEEVLRERRRALRNGSLTSLPQNEGLEQGQVVDAQNNTSQGVVSLHGLESEYRITNMPLFIKSVIVLTITIILFFLHSFIPSLYLDLGWIAIAGGITLLVVADIEDLEEIISRVEWATLLFFAALFVLMEGIASLGLLAYIGDALSSLIASVNPDARLAVAILLVLWTSAIVSAFIDNIPFTTAMIPVVIQLSESPSVNLPLQPLVWALAFGTCLGGNGTLIGASANVVCAGISGSYGYPITFNYFFKTGAPFAVVTLIGVTAYLMVCHPLAGWNS